MLTIEYTYSELKKKNHKGQMYYPLLTMVDEIVSSHTYYDIE